mmetsp:Transcript_3478/g.6924  ORF Transcript_3478/g.6924 Transcript_3478/m.6924 type:complete len:211 (+) Transcript_3478:619-1251(+)|eukprot:scaffold5860_cov223-Amphora_coffeaeformis.AAC.9
MDDHPGTTSIPWAWVKQVRVLVDQSIQIKPVPSEISPWLYLSDERNVLDCAKLRQFGITHVLTVMTMPLAKLEEFRRVFHGAGINHYYCDGEDDEDYDMIGRHWGECYTFLQHVHDSGGKVVVHCSAGINRSGLIASAAKMILERRPLLQVVEHMIQQRGCVLWNRSFQMQLCMLAAHHDLLGAKPPNQTDDPIEQAPLSPPSTKSVFYS